jgi:hypothetical protein
MRVRCKDDSPGNGPRELVKGKVYEVDTPLPGFSGTYRLVGFSNYNWSIRCFDIMPDATTPMPFWVECINIDGLLPDELTLGQKYQVTMLMSVGGGAFVYYLRGNTDTYYGEHRFRMLSTTTDTASAVVGGAAVNDHVCPSCKNHRCSRSEKLCWKCGDPLFP